MVEITTLEEFKEVAETLDYRFAKTYAKTNPHEYSVWFVGENHEKIKYLNKYIQEHGEIEMFYRKPFKVVFAGEHKYWQVGDWKETNFLNRNWDTKNEDGTINKSRTEARKVTE